MSHIAGKYSMTSADNVAAFFKSLGATDEMLSAGADKEEKTLEVADNGGDSYTIDIGPAKNTFTVGKEFEHQMMKLQVK